MFEQTTAAWAVAGLLVVGAGVAGALSADGRTAVVDLPSPSPTASAPPSPSPTASPRTPVEAAQLAAVKLSWPCDAPTLEDCPYGSGSVVDSSGLIVTNAHVAAPASPGLAEQYADLEQDASNPPYLVVSVAPSPEADAVPLYRASVAAVDGYTDLAVVRVDANADGSPLDAPPVLTNVPLGALAETRKDDEIRVIGYPASGDSLSPTVQRGTIASKPVDTEERVDGPWELNTSAPIHGGNSGGLVIDAQGRLIAIPAYRRGFDEQVYRARAVELARPLIEAARYRRPYLSPYLVEGTGDEQLVGVAWSDSEFGNACIESTPETLFLEPVLLDVLATLSGLAVGENYRVVITGPDGGPVTSSHGTLAGEGCVGLRVESPHGDPLPAGTYTLTAYVGPSSTEIGSSAVEVTEARDGDTLLPDGSDSTGD